jgi:RNA-directed DNA polymerase
VSPEDARRQKPTQLGLPLQARGEAPREQRSGEASTLTNGEVRSGSDHLMEEVVARGNVKAALARVRENRGSPGVDGMTVEELPQYRQMDPPPAAGAATQTVETRPQGLCRVAQTRRSRGRCWASRRKHPPVVAQLGSAPAARSRYSLLRPHGSAKLAR